MSDQRIDPEERARRIQRRLAGGPGDPPSLDRIKAILYADDQEAGVPMSDQDDYITRLERSQEKWLHACRNAERERDETRAERDRLRKALKMAVEWMRGADEAIHREYDIGPYEEADEIKQIDRLLSP
jgi:hypothetical protein